MNFSATTLVHQKLRHGQMVFLQVGDDSLLHMLELVQVEVLQVRGGLQAKLRDLPARRVQEPGERVSLSENPGKDRRGAGLLRPFVEGAAPSAPLGHLAATARRPPRSDGSQIPFGSYISRLGTLTHRPGTCAYRFGTSKLVDLPRVSVAIRFHIRRIHRAGQERKLLRVQIPTSTGDRQQRQPGQNARSHGCAEELH
jgi:hypothetical protein